MTSCILCPVLRSDAVEQAVAALNGPRPAERCFTTKALDVLLQSLRHGVLFSPWAKQVDFSSGGVIGTMLNGLADGLGPVGKLAEATDLSAPFGDSCRNAFSVNIQT